MQNKYNVRAKRLALDNMIRKRAWNSFQTSFSELSSTRDNQNHHVVDGGSSSSNSSADIKKREANLCQAVVLCRNHQTTHRSLLHSLCEIPPDSSPPSSDLIHLVASACPRSLLLKESSTGGGTPLHLAIGQGASLNTIKSLMAAADTTNCVKRQDLLLAVDGKLQTPLVLAVRKGVVEDDIVKYLVNQDVDGPSLLFSGAGKRDFKPLKYVASREFIFVGEGLDNPQALLLFMILRTYRAKLKKRFPFLHYKKSDGNDGGDQDNTDQTTNSAFDDDNNTCLLQATLFCYDLIGSSKIASSILSYIIRNGLFHRERLESLRDYAGNLTLHIACLSDTPKFDRILKLGDRESDYGLNSEDCTVMEYLMNANPPPCTAPYLSQNFDGEIPLHCAIKSGKDLSHIRLLICACPGSVRTCTVKGELPLHLAIKCGNYNVTSIMELWNRYPEAASILDRSTGLYPFQLAATFGVKQQQTKNKPRKKTRSVEAVHPRRDWDETSLSYFMLRECPSLISSSLILARK